MIISLSYILLFITFSQSYNAVVYGEVPIFHFERYTIQILPLLVVLAGIGINEIVNTWSSASRKVPMRYAWVFAVCASLYFGLVERRAYADEENQTRRLPVAHACADLKAGDTVVTDEIILFELFCRKDLNYISLNSLGSGIPLETMDIVAYPEMYFWINVESFLAERDRYPSAASFVSSRFPEIFSEGSAVERHQLYLVK